MTGTHDTDAAPHRMLAQVAPLHTRLQSIRYLSQELARPRDANALFRAIYEATASVLDVEAFLVGFYDAVSQTVEVIGQIEGGIELPGGNFPIGDGLTSQVIRSRLPRLIRHWSVDGPPVHVRYASNTRGLPESGICVPLLFGEQILGVMAAYSYQPSFFDEDDLLLVEIIASQAAVAIANLSQSDRVNAQLQRRVSELETILASMTDALLIVDDQGRAVRLNHAARRLLSLNNSSAVLGNLLVDPEHWHDWPDATQQVARCLKPLIEALQRGEPPAETEVDLPGQARRVLSFSSSPLQDSFGASTGGVLMVRDVTGRREAEELKDEMLAIASHDLRVPITVIRAQAQLLIRLLERGTSTTATLREGLQSIVGQTEHLSRLLALLLDLSRIESGRFDLQPDRMDLRALAARSVSDIQATTTRHEISLRAARAVIGQWDERRLREVLDNLLTNAVKYSPEGGPIDVIVRAGKRDVTVCVVDSGVGLQPDEAPHVFERFYRGKGIRQLQGAGLGLYICQAVVSAHGGRIWAKSAGPGSGTSFCFTLPRGPETPLPD